MGSQKQLIYLQNKETGEIYHTRKNKKLVERNLKYKKYSKKLRKRVEFEEVKKPLKIQKATLPTTKGVGTPTASVGAKKGTKQESKKAEK